MSDREYPIELRQRVDAAAASRVHSARSVAAEAARLRPLELVLHRRPARLVLRVDDGTNTRLFSNIIEAIQ